MLRSVKVYLCTGMVFLLLLTVFPANTVTAAPGKNNSNDLVVKEGTTTYTIIELTVKSVKISRKGTLILEKVILRVENKVKVCNEGTFILINTRIYAGDEIEINNKGALTASDSFLKCKQIQRKTAI